MTLLLVDNRTVLADEPANGAAVFYPSESNATVVPRPLISSVRAVSFPTPNSPAWGYMNRRRVELIRRKVRGGLDPDEEQELSRLQRESLAAVDRSFPRPPVDLQAVAELERRLKKGRLRSWLLSLLTCWWRN
jgi:hypothetical protein